MFIHFPANGIRSPDRCTHVCSNTDQRRFSEGDAAIVTIQPWPHRTQTLRSGRTTGTQCRPPARVLAAVEILVFQLAWEVAQGCEVAAPVESLPGCLPELRLRSFSVCSTSSTSHHCHNKTYGCQYIFSIALRSI